MFYIYQNNDDDVSISLRFVCLFIRQLKILHRTMYLNHALLTVYRRYLYIKKNLNFENVLDKKKNKTKKNTFRDFFLIK